MAELRVEKIGLYDHLRSRWMRFLRDIITQTNMWILRKSGGRLGNSFLGKPVLLLHTIGCKSGVERVIPIFYLTDGDKVILVASNAGTTTNPAWFNNIRANPAAKVNIRGQERKMLGHIASAEEHKQYWPKVTEMFPTWDKIQDKSVRNFPIIILEPQTGN